MVMSLIEKKGAPVKTQIRCSIKESKCGIFAKMVPVKRSSRYVYYEVEGDLLNPKRNGGIVSYGNKYE